MKWAGVMNLEATSNFLVGSVPDLAIDSIEVAGDGDYCRAYNINREWLFLIAKHPEGSRSLERVSGLLPALAPTLPLPIPRITYAGRASECFPAFVGYPKIQGISLTAERLRGLSGEDQARCAADLAVFLRGMHCFPLDAARQAGIPVCAYPFAATEDGLTDGTAEEQYRHALERILSYTLLDQAMRDFCQRIVAEHLEGAPAEVVPLALLHGEVSSDHLLIDPATRRLTGVIDFNGAIIGDPVRDLLYLYEDYGVVFLVSILDHYPIADRPRLLAKLHFFHAWHTVLRLLWALDHQYSPGIRQRLKELREIQRRAEVSGGVGCQ